MLARGGSIGLLKRLEQPPHLLLSKPYAGVAHRKTNQLAILIFFLDARFTTISPLSVNFTALLQKLIRICPKRSGSPFNCVETAGSMSKIVPTLCRRFLRNQVADILQHLLQIEIDIFDRQFSSFDLPLLTYISYRDIVSKVPPWLCKWSAMPSFRYALRAPRRNPMTRLSLKAMAIAAGLLWSGGILFVGVINPIFATYGNNFISAD